MLEQKAIQTRNGFATIAAWQFAAFVLLLLMVWAGEVLDLPAVLYGRPQQPVDFFRASLLSAFVIVTAIITVGHTYVTQQRILSGFITVCAKCHKVKLDEHMWQQIEKYVAHYCPVTFSHGLCPGCYVESLRELERARAAAAENARRGS